MLDKHVSRREFLQVSSAGALGGAVALHASDAAAAAPAAGGPFRGILCLFSKPVPQLNWKELAESTKRAGFGGVDLTVRSEGHVLPERAETDLPKAVEAIRNTGLEVPMITTELLSADDPTARPIISTASKLHIPYLKPGYYHYKLVNVQEEVAEAGRRFSTLVDLAKDHGIQVGYHNHPHYIGEAIWDMARVIEPLDPQWSGFYYDLCQATIEGGESGWRVSTNLVTPRLKMVAAKDFLWKQSAPHRWHAVVCPMGDGMSRWKEFFQILAKTDFHGPVSYQHEYLIPGYSHPSGIALSRDKVPTVMAAIKKNLDYIKSVIREAYGEA
ncbi:MAG TPA: sugar phosphate isomerase/epimerase family protein [Terriglobia bacterium]|nr:sugar phosphate isomerase/epimerase family protein [Terriglobia bacterium]